MTEPNKAKLLLLNFVDFCNSEGKFNFTDEDNAREALEQIILDSETFLKINR